MVKMEDVSVVQSEPDLASSFDFDISFAIPGDKQNETFDFDLPKGEIQAVKSYKEWCVLSVARGNGPRRVEEWIVANEESCFEQPMVTYSSDSEEYSDQEPMIEDDNSPKSQAEKVAGKVIPVLANPHSAACAHSLVLVPRSPALMGELTYMRMLIHCLVKGCHQPGSTVQLASVIEGKRVVTNAICLEVVPSNSAGYISLMAAYNDTTNGHHIAPRQFQRHFEGAGWPILGATRHCYPFRGEKMCMSVVGLEFQAKRIDRRQFISVPPVPKLRRLLEKEERFWKERQGVDDVRVELFSSETPKPLEYVNEKATFDGLEFRVTRDCMIPRQGTVALVDIAEDYVSSHKWLDRSPRILDLGTGCGNILLATLKRLCHLDAVGVGVDASNQALQLCEYNIAALGFQDRASTVVGKFSQLCNFRHESFDVVLCNPPYIPNHGCRRKLDARTNFEPEKALYVDRETPNIHYEDIIEGLKTANLLNPGALVVFEVCKENAEEILKLMVLNGFVQTTIGRDWKNCIRTVRGRFLRM